MISVANDPLGCFENATKIHEALMSDVLELNVNMDYFMTPGAELADIVLLCGAQENPLDSGSIPIKVAVLYVAEVLRCVICWMTSRQTNEAQDRTTEALAVKML